MVQSKQKVGFRGWFYFRMGWSTYFAFILAALNTLTVTYYLAIDNYPVLKQIFPSFELYIVVIVSIGIPLLIFIGYAHYKKTQAYRSEADIWIESNPYQARWLVNTEIILKLNLKFTELLTKLSKGETLSDQELKEITDLQNEFSQHVDTRTFDNKKDKDFFVKYG